MSARGIFVPLAMCFTPLQGIRVTFLVLFAVCSAVCHAGGIAEGNSRETEASASEAPTLAIVNRHANPVLADLLFERLAQRQTVRLLERDRIDLAVKELDLAAVSPRASLRLGAMLHAQGLLFVSTDKGALHVVLVETERGIRLFDLVRDATPENFERLSQETEQALQRAVTKLRLRKERRRYVALMPSETRGSLPAGLAVASLDTLFGLQLAGASDVFVVEREHLNAVVAESKLAGYGEAALTAADYVVRTTCRQNDPDEVEVSLQVKAVRSGNAQSRTFRMSETNRLACVSEASAWLARVVLASRPEPIDAAAESARHYANALAFSARGQGTEAQRCYEIAYLLRPGEPAYATAYSGVLRSRMEERTCRTLDRTDALVEALRIHQALHPEGAEYPLPSFLYSIPEHATADERQALQDCRRRLKAYYADYCRLDSDLPDPQRRCIWARVFPLFFDNPEEALTHLKWLLSLGGVPWDILQGHSFTAVAHWDAAKARRMWLAYLDELSHSDDLATAAQAHRTRCLYLGAFAYAFVSPNSHFHAATPEQTDAVKAFFNWAIADPTRHRAIRSGVNDRVWCAFGRLPLDVQRRYFETLMMPNLEVAPLEYGYAVAYLDALLAAHPGNPDGLQEVSRFLDLALNAVQKVDSFAAPAAIERIRSLYPALLPLVPADHFPAAAAPNPEFLVEGFTKLFSGQRDVPEAIRDNAQEFGGPGFLVDEPYGWLAWTSCQVSRERHERWHVMLSRLDPVTGISTVYGIRTPEAMSTFGEGVRITRWGDRLCVADLCNVLVIPIEKQTGEVNVTNVIRLVGLPKLGHTSLRVSALIPAGESLYVGVCGPWLHHGEVGNYGALFRWQPGMMKVEEVAAAAGVDAGPLSDTHPYIIAEGEADGNTGDVLFLVQSNAGGPRAGWWRYAPQAPLKKWAWIGERERVLGEPSPWRIARDTRKGIYELVYVENGQTVTAARYRSQFAIMNVVSGEHTVFWIVGDNVYALPKAKWPAGVGLSDPGRK